MSKSKKIKIQNNSHYYKILDNSILPQIIPKSARYSYDPSPQKTAQRIVKSQHFVYIDLFQQSGCRIMQQSIPKQNDQQIQKIGDGSYIFNLKNLSERDQQTIQYLNKLKQSQQHKQSIRKIVKKQLDNSISKLNKRKNYKLDYTQFKQKRQLQFDPVKLRELVQTDQLQALNQNIWMKQKRLIDKLGILDNYISVSPGKRQNVMNRSQMRGKLPALNYKTIQR